MPSHFRLINAAIPTLVRGGTIAISLAAVTYTYKFLTVDDFSLFNLILFCIAVGTAIASPINRSFWAGNSRSIFSRAWVSTALIVAVCTLLGVVVAGLTGSDASTEVLLIAICGLAYGTAKIFERFAYGMTLIEQNLTRALIIPLLFVVCESASLAIMWSLDFYPLAFRLLGPTILFVFIVAVSQLAGRYVKLLDSASLLSLRVYINDTVFSSVGIQVLLLTVLATLAVMLDRLILVFVPTTLVPMKGDYLLALSYAIALQTLMSLVFDLARKHVYYNDEWQPQARAFVRNAIAAVFVIFVVAVGGYTVLIDLGILPETIDLFLWIGLLSRSLALLLINICNIDRFQSGNIVPLLLPNLIVLFAGALAISSIILGSSTWIAGTILITADVLLAANLVLTFYKRLPAASELRQGSS